MRKNNSVEQACEVVPPSAQPAQEKVTLRMARAGCVYQTQGRKRNGIGTLFFTEPDFVPPTSDSECRILLRVQECEQPQPAGTPAESMPGPRFQCVQWVPG